MEVTRGVTPKMKDDAWDIMTDHCAKFHANQLLLWAEIRNQTDKKRKK